MTGWTLDDMPLQAGKRALVTGATSGIGKVTATELARHGAEVLVAGRDQDKLAATVGEIAAAAPDASVSPLLCDLAELSSVRRAADEAATGGAVDILVNNAGVMATPRGRTADGFELQFGTNHLGHFALTGLLIDSLAESGDARVVTVSSVMAWAALAPPLGDPHVEPRRYLRWVEYSRSKLANLLFAFELDRRARAKGLPLRSLAAHPGSSPTSLQRESRLFGVAVSLYGQSPEMAAWPTLMAATSPEARGGTLVGPNLMQTRGPARVVLAPRPAHDKRDAARLWELSESATGVVYP
jgi:NAD(P)-dependent dehydrogenase (short-subunit alcohol dehydrogenase family)